MKAEIVNQPELRVAAIRHIGPYPGIAEAFGRLGAIAGQAGLLGPGTMMLAIYHDDPDTTPEAQLRSDAAVTLPPAAPLPGGLTEGRVPAGRHARATHVGPYEELGGVWASLKGEWLPQSGHRAGAGASYEVYRNTPMTAKPSELITELYIPVK